MNLPKLDLSIAPDWQKERLARWLAARDVDQELCAEGTEDGGGVSGDVHSELPVAPVSSEPPPECRQIRLFSPLLPATRERLLYAAVLEECMDGSFLIAPYGRFSEPCVPGELLGSREAPCLRVLCLWNAVEAPSTLLAKSWVVDTLSDDEFEAATAVRRHLASRETLPSGLAERIGPPLWHPADPRRRYLDEERRTMEALLGGTGGSIEYPTLSPAWPIAADPHDPYGARPSSE